MKNGAMRVVRSSGASWRNGSFTAMLAAVVCSTGMASGQIFQPTIPDFEPAVVFVADIGAPYGIDSADFLMKDANGNWVPGQDGYPEIAVAGAGVNLFQYCTDNTESHNITIFRNTGNWDTDPTDSLEIHQDNLVIPDFDGGNGLNIRATELGFADVTGEHGPDLILLGYNSDVGSGNGYLLIYKNLGNGFFDTNPVLWTTNATTLRGLVTADFDLDGDIDIIGAASECDASGKDRDFVVLFKNTTVDLGTFGIDFGVNIPLSIPNDLPSGDIVMGDFYPLSPGMPLLDLVTTNPQSGSITKLANLGLLQFDINNQTTIPSCAFDWKFVAATTDQFGADAHWDFAAVNPDVVAARVFKGSGLGQFETDCDWNDPFDPAPYQLYPPDYPDYERLKAHGIASGRLNADAYPDIVVAIRSYYTGLNGPGWTGAVGVLLGLPDGSFKVQSSTQAYIFSTMDGYGDKQTAGAALVEIVDLNADGFDDIVVTNHESGSLFDEPDNISVLINKMFESVSP